MLGADLHNDVYQLQVWNLILICINFHKYYTKHQLLDIGWEFRLDKDFDEDVL